MTPCMTPCITVHSIVVQGGIDFILCIGDDSGDEYMFQALAERFSNSATQAGR